MEDWMKLPVSQLKRLVKSRAGRVAELQMEIKILEGIMEKKVSEGDLGGSAPRDSRPEPAKPKEKPVPEKADAPEEDQAPQEPGKQQDQTKIKEKSSDHAFKEID
jgi:outer membrane biosynthesis protein TonB